MEPRRLLIALVLLAGLGGAYYWNLRDKKAEEGKPKADAPPKILSIPSDQIQQVEWVRRNGDQVAMKLDPQSKQWAITAPKPYPADQTTAEGVVSTVSSLGSESLIDEKPSDLASFGLAPPAEQVTITKKDGKTTKLLVGDDAPTGGGTYLKLGDDPRVFLLSTSVRGTLDKSLNDLRDRRLLRFDVDKLSRLEVKKKDQTLEFGRNGRNEWTILQPKPQRADGGKIDDLLSKLHAARFDPAGSEDEQKKAAAAFGSGTPVGTAVLTTSAGSESLEVRRDKEGKYYGKSSAADGIWSLDASLAGGLEAGLAEYQNKKLFDLGFEPPERVDVRSDTKSVSLQRSGEKWMAAGKQMDPIGVMSLNDRVRDLTATRIVDTPMPPSVQVDVLVISGNGKRTEKLKLAKQGSGYLGQREGESATYELDAKAVNDLVQAATDVKPSTKK